MSTKQVAANRLNAQRSAGRSQVIAGEDPAELRDLTGKYSAGTRHPRTVLPRRHPFIDANWLLRRYSLADAKVLDYYAGDRCVRDDPTPWVWPSFCREHLRILQRRADSAQPTFRRALHDLQRLEAKRRAATPQSTPYAADAPPKAKANFAQLQSAQQKLGSFFHFALPRDPDSPVAGGR
ncbi:MAG TPA: hypothetical protein VNY05_04490 [Candidatus Acidoferrales bacterium]|jgi:hypothetical protein|nr:hypothetical protein [Candidatus Acidoferrales bacterium]